MNPASPEIDAIADCTANTPHRTVKPNLTFEPVSNPYKLDPHIKFLEHAARHFEHLPTNGEDKAHWANVYNAKNCRDIAAEIERLRAALQRIATDDCMDPWAIARAALSQEQTNDRT